MGLSEKTLRKANWASKRLVHFFVILWLVQGGLSFSRLWNFSRTMELPLSQLNSVVTDSKGLIYAGSTAFDRIQVYDPNGQFIAGWSSKTYGKGFQLFIDTQNRVMVDETFLAKGPVHILDSNGLYLGDLSRIEFLKIKPNHSQNSFGNFQYKANEWSTFYPEIMRRSGNGPWRAFVKPNPFETLLQFPFPLFIWAFISMLVGAYTQKKLSKEPALVLRNKGYRRR